MGIKQNYLKMDIDREVYVKPYGKDLKSEYLQSFYNPVFP